MEAVIAAVISGVLTGVVSLFGFILANGKDMAVLKEQVSGLRRDMTDMKKDMDKTNHIKERTLELEGDMKAVKTDVENIYHKIEDLKGAA